jgi:TIR domain
MAGPVDIFISHAQGDEDHLNELIRQLTPMQRQGSITLWDTRQIAGGAVTANEIEKHVNSAQIFLLLITSNYISSDNYSLVVNRAMARQQRGEAFVIPILLNWVFWEDEPYGNLRPLPDNRKPVSAWTNRGEAFFNIAEGIRKVVEELTKPARTTLPPLEIKNKVMETTVQNAASHQPDDDFDVFLCYNKVDRPEVRKIGERLKAEGIKPWLDEWELRPGLPWQRALEKQIEHIKSAAVFVGKDSVGPWEQMELEAFLREFVKRGCPVIPVLMANAPAAPQLPLFLQGMTWVDFRKSVPDPMFQFIWGITGKRPTAINTPPQAGGKVNSPSQATGAASTSSTMQTGLPSWKRRDLEQRRENILGLRDMRNKKIQRFQEALAIETDLNTIIKYEQQLSQERAALESLTKELEEIEQQLQ